MQKKPNSINGIAARTSSPRIARAAQLQIVALPQNCRSRRKEALIFPQNLIDKPMKPNLQLFPVLRLTRCLLALALPSIVLGQAAAPDLNPQPSLPIDPGVVQPLLDG